MKQNKPLLLLFLVVGVAVIGISFTTIWADMLRPKTTTEFQSELQHEVKTAEGFAGEGWEQIDATLRFKADHLSNVPIDDSFTVSTTFEIIDAAAYAVSIGPRRNSKTPLDLPQNQLFERVRQAFSGPEMGSKPKAGFELLMPGADVSPDTPQTSSLDSAVEWTVRPRSKGTLLGSVRVKWFEDELNPRERWDLRFEKDHPITVKVTDRFWNFANFSTWFARFVGTLLTIPGILVAIWTVFAGRKTTAEPTGPRIILPGEKGF